MKIKLVYLISFVLALAAGNQAMAETLYYDSFSEASGSPLNGTTPDISINAYGAGGGAWAAGADFDVSGAVTFHNADGSLGDGAYLPFHPLEGYTYTLSAFVDTRPSALRSNNPNDWMALGFSRVNTPVERRFYDDPGGVTYTDGVYWMMSRTNLAVSPNFDQDFVGYKTNGGATGTTLSADNLKIVLDTTGSITPGIWTVSWYFNNILQRTVNVGVGPPAFVPDPLLIPQVDVKDYFQYIMISNNRCDGFIDNVTLTVVPEPATSTMALMGLIGLGLYWLRRK